MCSLGYEERGIPAEPFLGINLVYEVIALWLNRCQLGSKSGLNGHIMTRVTCFWIDTLRSNDQTPILSCLKVPPRSLL